MGEPVCCPNCKEPLNFWTISRLTAQSEVTMKIAPKKGQLLSATTAFGTILQVEKALKALGREHGAKTTVSIRKIETDESGEISVVFVAANAEQVGKKKEARK